MSDAVKLPSMISVARAVRRHRRQNPGADPSDDAKQDRDNGRHL
jgi:hypothetical protein